MRISRVSILNKAVMTTLCCCFLLWVCACQGTAPVQSTGTASSSTVVTATPTVSSTSANTTNLPKSISGTGADDESPLSKGLLTVKILGENAGDKTVTYFPVGIMLGTGSNRQAGHFLKVPMGTRAMIQGTISLYADEKEEATLLERVKAKNGDDWLIKKHLPDSFAVTAEIEGKSALNRPQAGGSLEGIPVQAVVEIADPKKPLTCLVRVEFFSPGFGKRFSRQAVESTTSATQTISKSGPNGRIIQETREITGSTVSGTAAVSSEDSFSFERKIELK